jgi:hypothetical protein
MWRRAKRQTFRSTSKTCTNATRASRRLTALMVEVTCVTSVSKGARFPFSKPLHVSYQQERFRILTGSGISRLTARELSRSSAPGTRLHPVSQCPRASPCEETPDIASRSASPSRTSEAGSSSSGARSVSEFSSDLFFVKRDLRRSQKNFNEDACVLKVTSPNGEHVSHRRVSDTPM